MTPEILSPKSLRAARLRAQGLTRQQIAKRMGMTPQGISYLLPDWRPGAGRPGVPDHVRAEIIRMANAGVIYRVIAEKLKVGVATVHKYANTVS